MNAVGSFAAAIASNIRTAFHCIHHQASPLVSRLQGVIRGVRLCKNNLFLFLFITMNYLTAMCELLETAVSIELNFIYMQLLRSSMTTRLALLVQATDHLRLTDHKCA